MRSKQAVIEQATFGAGCFWGVELLFAKTPGVISATSGYMGGDEKKYPNPTYRQVCTGTTGYAEVVHITFDLNKISYEQLLDIFWKHHNPTTLNQQGPDVGSQYRSIIFYHTSKQKQTAQSSKVETQERFAPKTVVTFIEPAGTFFPAEEYHQKYLEKHGMDSCHL